jgi:hypothetical protein
MTRQWSGWSLAVAMLLLRSVPGAAQAYSPTILKAGQPDPTDLKALASGIYAQSGAKTSREKAEAIWRFFLTDGRFVKPGFWYHIAGWAYEEPLGEVLDPAKLLNSYGFGLCYQIAPLLEAVYDAGGFEDARVWFLTGHTVAEVFYEGQYHYFDSDMMGYNPVGNGPLKQRPVASVHQIEQNGNIILGKMKGPKEVEPGAVDSPWYPADVQAGAIGDLAELFTTTNNNWLYAFRRYPAGHRMAFALRPGERMIRYFQPESPDLYYLPYQFDGASWHEFPREFPEYNIKTADGPRSQKDQRLWATGRIEYQPPHLAEQAGRTTLEFNMPCPYVVIDAQFAMSLHLASSSDSVSVETSTDEGRTWTEGSQIAGPFQGKWTASPAILAKTAHGTKNAVSGTYCYRVRIHLPAAATAQPLISDLLLTTRFQLNPRTLPDLTEGRNTLQFRTAREERIEHNVAADCFEKFASKAIGATFVGEQGQGYVANQNGQAAEITFKLDAGSTELRGFEAGGRFLDLRQGLAPDKLTAEVRRVQPWPSPDNSAEPDASISWSLSPEGPFQSIWRYNPKLQSKDGVAIDRTLRWPETDRLISQLPTGTHTVYVRYTLRNMAVDNFRMAEIRPVTKPSDVKITHTYTQNGTEQQYTRTLNSDSDYTIEIPAAAPVTNKAIVLECPAR